MTQYVVEGSNGVPGVADMRYSVSMNGNSGLVMNLIVRPYSNSSFAYRGVRVNKIEGNEGHYRIEFLPNYSGHYMSCYGARNERKAMIPVCYVGLPRSIVAMADTHIRVFNWYYNEEGNLIVDVVMGKGRHIMVSETKPEMVPAIQTEALAAANDDIIFISVSQPEVVVDNMIATCRRNNIAFRLAA